MTGFHFHPTERPIGFFIAPNQETHLFVPALEHEHAEEFACVDKVHSYPEYPGLRHPMEYFKDALVEAGFAGKRVGFDADGYGSSMGYRGPKVSQFLEAESFASIYGVVEEMRVVKSPAEIELIKESCRWGNLAHRLLQKYSKPGLSEIEITTRASSEATMAMIETLGPDYKPHGNTAYAIFRGQVGAMSAFPHAVTQNLVLKKAIRSSRERQEKCGATTASWSGRCLSRKRAKSRKRIFNTCWKPRTSLFNTSNRVFRCRRWKKLCKPILKKKYSASDRTPYRTCDRAARS